MVRGISGGQKKRVTTGERYIKQRLVRQVDCPQAQLPA